MRAPEILKLDPELEHLLRELAAEPDSSLLRVARPAVMPALFETNTVVSQHATGLLPVEREILRAHRAELVEVLLDFMRDRLLNSGPYDVYMTGGPQFIPGSVGPGTGSLGRRVLRTTGIRCKSA